MEQEYIITVFSENKVGLLSQITTVFTCRDVNIESLTTSESALQGIHKFTIAVRTTPDQVDKLVRLPTAELQFPHSLLPSRLSDTEPSPCHFPHGKTLPCH